MLVAAASSAASAMRSSEQRLARIAVATSRAVGLAPRAAAALGIAEASATAPDNPITAAAALIEVQRSDGSAATGQRNAASMQQQTPGTLA